MFVTTLAPITLPYFEKIIFKSVARVSDDSPDTQRLRLDVDVDFADDDDDELLAAFAESAIAHSRAHFDNINLKMICF